VTAITTLPVYGMETPKLAFAPVLPAALLHLLLLHLVRLPDVPFVLLPVRNAVVLASIVESLLAEDAFELESHHLKAFVDHKL